MEDKGLPLVPDMFSNGETAHGCGHAPRTGSDPTTQCRSFDTDSFKVHKGIRTTGADFVTNDYHRGNIDLMVETLVDKINFEKKNAQLEATSVVLVDKSGEKRIVRARKEVVVSGGNLFRGWRPRETVLTPSGAYCSPAILLRSGIGAKADLEQLGIECLVDAPGVGKNLLDHLVWFLLSGSSVCSLTHHRSYSPFTRLPRKV